MEELLLADSASTAMSINNISSSSSTLRFLQLINQPESVSITHTRTNDQLELHESDVVWSFSVSPSHSNSASPSPPSKHYNPAKSGISAVFSDDHHHHIRRKSTLNRNLTSPATRKEEIGARFHQSAPVNIPLWNKELRGNYKNDDWSRVDEDDDEVIGEEEMVPPHVVVARSHVTFSVFEGVGRTLKGRDLCRVRNSVFQKTGFID